MAVNRGRLVAFEGIDGCGKSTQLAKLAELLRSEGTDLVTTREPTEGVHGRRIREMARADERVAPERELAWFEADRREHVDRVLFPALAAGRLVLTDRYFFSSVAYQGARGLDWQRILERSEAAFPIPDRVLLLEIDPAAGLARVRQRGAPPEPAFERRDFLTRVAAIFAAIDRPYVQRIDASRSVETVHEEVVRGVRVLLASA